MQLYSRSQNRENNIYTLKISCRNSLYYNFELYLLRAMKPHKESFDAAGCGLSLLYYPRGRLLLLPSVPSWLLLPFATPPPSPSLFLGVSAQQYSLFCRMLGKHCFYVFFLQRLEEDGDTLIKLTLLLHRGGRHIVKQRVKQSSKTLVKTLKTL